MKTITTKKVFVYLIISVCFMLTSCGDKNVYNNKSDTIKENNKESVIAGEETDSGNESIEDSSIPEEYMARITDINKLQESFGKDRCLVNKYYVYGERYNFEGSINLKKSETLSDVKKKDIDKVTFALVDTLSESTLVTKECGYSYKKGKLHIYLSKKINKGISLETIKNGAYVQSINIKLKDGRNEAIPLIKKCKEKNIEYITITDVENGGREKVDITSVKNKNEKYMVMCINPFDEEDDVYDFAIDPGHGGSDVGAIHASYYEKNLTLELAQMVAENLKEKGYKVLLTRDGSEDNETYTVYNSYDEDGRVTLCCNSRAKYAISIHFNSGGSAFRGLQVYCSNKGSTDFASSIVSSLVDKAGAEVSNQEINKRTDGVYKRVFNENDINELISLAATLGFEPYDVSLGDDYFYMIRELGGIITAAYVDGRSPEYPTKNVNLDSNIGIESLLCEICYLSDEKDRYYYLSNKEKYAQGISEGIINYVNQNK